MGSEIERLINEGMEQEKRDIAARMLAGGEVGLGGNRQLRRIGP